MAIITLDYKNSYNGNLTGKNLTSFLNYLKVENDTNYGILMLFIQDKFSSPITMVGDGYGLNKWTFNAGLSYFTVTKDSNGNYAYNYRENV